MKPLAIIGLVSTGLLALSACGHDAARSGRVQVTVWSGWTGEEAKSFQRLCDRFNAEHPGIHVDNLGGVTDNTKVIRAITAGVPPDAFTIWSAPDVGPLAGYGALCTLDEEFRASGLKESDFVPSALEMCRYRGKLIGVPLLMDTLAFLWNKDAFVEAGHDPEHPPRTLEEMKKLAARLTVRNADGDIERLGMMLPDTTLLTYAFGGGYLDAKTGAVTANRAENVQALTFYADLVRSMGGRGKVAAFGSGFGQGQGPNHPFFVGKVAMMVNGEWIPSWIERYSPSLQYGVAPIPYHRGREDRAGTTTISVNMLGIPREAKHPKEAWQFLAWLQRPDVQTEFAQALNNVPNIRASLSEPDLTSGTERKLNFGKFCRYAMHPNAVGFPNTPIGHLYLTELGAATDFVLFGKKTPQQALDDVQRKVSSEMKRMEKSIRG